MAALGSMGPVPVDSQDSRLWFRPEAHQQRDTGLHLQALPSDSLPAWALLSVVTLTESPFNLLPALPCFDPVSSPMPFPTAF